MIWLTNAVRKPHPVTTSVVAAARRNAAAVFVRVLLNFMFLSSFLFLDSVVIFVQADECYAVLLFLFVDFRWGRWGE